MIDYNKLKFDGRVNSINGIRYRYSRKENSLSFYGVSFFVDNVTYKKKSVKVTMHDDVNHERPHIHVGDHEASFDINDGSLIVGNCKSKIKRKVQEWIGEHRDDLLELWEIVKAGNGDDRRECVINRIRGNR